MASIIENVIRIAKQQVGKPYVWGATGPDSFDCSGLVYYAFKQIGINVGRTTYDLLDDSQFMDVSSDSLQRGDLAFPKTGHVLIYLGPNDPDGQFIHAPQTGDVVKFVSSHYVWKGRRFKKGSNQSSVNISSDNYSGVIGSVKITSKFPKNYKPRKSAGSLETSNASITFTSGTSYPVYEKKTLGTTDWVRIEQGWIPVNAGRGGDIYLTYSSTYDSTTAESVSEKTNFQNTIDMEQFNSFYSDYMKNYKDTYYSNYVKSVSTAIDKDSAASLFLQKPRGIHGMPYQYNKYVDRRLTNSIFGRKFAEKIVTKMPLLLIAPGKPKFMGTYKKDEKKNILSYLMNKGDSTIAELLEQKKEEGLLYDFEYDYADYYNYVNPLCQITAKYLGIENKKIDGTTLDNFRWENFTNKEFKNYFSSNENVVFYIDSETQISESFGNDTTKSTLADSFNSLSDLGREMQFLLGGDNGPQFEFLKSQNYDSTSEAFQTWMNDNVSILPSTLISRLTEGGLNIVTGGKMIFPEIWADSSFSKSYGIKIKLRSPDADDFSIYMNILAPLLHLICLVAPHSKGCSSYNSPFIVKAYYKSIFNCNMGIITDMSISKGSTAKWNAKGLPTEVDVDFTIKDLYQLLTITSQATTITNKYSVDVLSNTLLMDYIANMCGININKPDILRTIDMYMAQIYNRNSISGRIDNGMLKLEQGLANNLKSLSKVFSIFK